MKRNWRHFSGAILLALCTALVSSAIAQNIQDVSGALHWRGIGPYRGGRTRGASGVPSQPNVFYIGVCDGGVWKTTDYGRTWKPIFDKEPTGSIGTVAVAPSDPNIVYVGSGEGLHRPDLSVGDGVYKSTNAGKTWTHLGLREGQQISQIAVDPRNPERLFVAVAGHPYGPNPERGIYRSTDGGKTFQKVLYKSENIGANDVQIDPSDPNTVYATLWEAREGPWENAAWNGTGGGIYKSTDGGNTWQELSKGLPAGIIQAYIAVAPSDPNRLYASVADDHTVGIYRSDDAGATWTLATTDPRPATRIGGGDLPVPKVDPKNADTLWMTSIVTWRSTDGGKTWTGVRGAPGGDDYQNMWINPNNPRIILLVGDQGAIITVNGGKSWSSWYNQPTAQLYHIAADNAFPYRLCSGQQESGSVCISTRGNDGEITIRDWHPVAAEEYGYVVPDPLDPDIIFGGKLTRYDRRTGQAQDVAPVPFRSPDYRVVRTEPIVFSPIDPHILYFASNTLWKTANGGMSWQKISPDLTRKTYAVPASVGKFSDRKSAAPIQRGVIYTVAPSPLNAGLIWVGTDDGNIQVTHDGGAHWTNVTPKQLSAWQKVSIIDAGHFDQQTAYAAVNTIRLDDLHPYIYRTHDGGKTWTLITNGIPSDENVNVVREDPVRKGLLFAGTENAVYVSFDDGDHWQSLRLNMPASSIRDLIIHKDDLDVATHGRGFWILDNITPLRQFDAKVEAAPATLFRPQAAYRVRWDMNTDTPLPPDFPAGQNPPDGAMIDYHLSTAPSGPVVLEIHDAAARLVRRYSSADPVPPPDPMLLIPNYWVRPPQSLLATAGSHRFLWDMHYAPVPGVPAEYPIAAVPHNTAPQLTSPWAMPGRYTVTLIVDGHKYTEPLTVKMDPRVKTPLAGLQEQFTESKRMYDDANAAESAIEAVASLQQQVEQLRKNQSATVLSASLDAFAKKASELAGAEPKVRFGPRPPMTTFTGMRDALLAAMELFQGADATPTVQGKAAAAERHGQFLKLMSRWQAFRTTDLRDLNTQLQKANLPEIKP